MRMCGKDSRAVRLPWENDIVDELPETGEKTAILDARHGLTDAESPGMVWIL